jgi:hypothetical protein
MSYLVPIEIEDTVLFTERTSAIPQAHAAQAARIIFARSPMHARRFALAMHKRVATGLDTDLIEHWARVVKEVGRIG